MRNSKEWIATLNGTRIDSNGFYCSAACVTAYNKKGPYDCSLRLRCITSALTVLARKPGGEQTFITINKTLTIGVLHIRSGTPIFALYYSPL